MKLLQAVLCAALLCGPVCAEEQKLGSVLDRYGNTAPDPTENVLALVEAAVKRLDDIQALTLKSTENQRATELRRLDDLRAAESRRIDEQAVLRSEYESKLQLAESSRINAIRAVDVGNVAVASERATAQASVLATQVTASADALRALVATTATTFATQQQLLQTQITERLSALEKGSYQTSGRASVSDPQLADLIMEMRSVTRSNAVDTGKSKGATALWGYLVGGAAVLVALGTYMKAGKDRQELERHRNGTPT